MIDGIFYGMILNMYINIHEIGILHNTYLWDYIAVHLNVIMLQVQSLWMFLESHVLNDVKLFIPLS